MTEISKEYGIALFMLACEKKAETEYGEALRTLESVFLETPAYLSFLASPSIPVGERLAAIRQAFADRLPEDVVSFLQLLCEKGRILGFYDAAEAYHQLLHASKQTVRANITSAIELTDEEKKALQQKLEALCKSNVLVAYNIDESLLGGVIAEVEGKVLDGSLRSRLRDIKEVISS